MPFPQPVICLYKVPMDTFEAVEEGEEQGMNGTVNGGSDDERGI